RYRPTRPAARPIPRRGRLPDRCRCRRPPRHESGRAEPRHRDPGGRTRHRPVHPHPPGQRPHRSRRTASPTASHQTHHPHRPPPRPATPRRGPSPPTTGRTTAAMTSAPRPLEPANAPENTLQQIPRDRDELSVNLSLDQPPGEHVALLLDYY